MMLGEVVFGGVGAGLYGVLVMVILAVFIAGLMVGRTPEYLGKKIEAYDVKMAMLSVLVFSLIILVFTAIGVVTTYGKAAITNPGPHGLSQILYAYTSGAANNGSPTDFACITGVSSGQTTLPAAETACGGGMSSVWFPDLRRDESFIDMSILVKF